MKKDQVILNPLRDQLLGNYYLRNEIIEYYEDDSQKEALGKFLDYVSGLEAPEEEHQIHIHAEVVGETLYLHPRWKNPDFTEEPPKDLKPWNGSEDDENDCRLGYYNCNWTGYNEFYSIAAKPWRELVNARIYVETSVYKALERNVVHLLYTIIEEMTQTGYEESQHIEFWQKMFKVVEDIKGSANMDSL